MPRGVGWENQEQTIGYSNLNSTTHSCLPYSCTVQPVASWFEGLCRSKRQEIELALNDLKNRDRELEPILKANVEFEFASLILTINYLFC